jgi:2-desacetyl-2-hydroxyethyl bacteriochlorophyllide A dehydrogenase
VSSKRIVFVGKSRVEVEQRPVPSPDALAPDQILVRARASLISTGTECIVLQQLYEPGTHWDRWVRFPFYPGYSMVGEVVAAGRGVTAVAPGQRVALRAGHAQHIVTNRWVTTVPDGVDDREAAWFALACIVQIGIRRAQIALGETVVVVGLGILGQLACQYARVCGARRVIAVDPARERLRTAERLGATHGLALPVGEAVQAVQALTGGELADVVFDVTGHASVFAPALAMVRRLGRLVLLGDTGTPSQQHLTGDVVTRGITIVGAHDSLPPAEDNAWYPWTHRRMAELFFDLLLQGRMNVRELTSHVVSPTDAPDVYRGLVERRGDYLGVVFDWTRL